MKKVIVCFLALILMIQGIKAQKKTTLVKVIVGTGNGVDSVTITPAQSNQGVIALDSTDKLEFSLVFPKGSQPARMDSIVAGSQHLAFKNDLFKIPGDLPGKTLASLNRQQISYKRGKELKPFVIMIKSASTPAPGDGKPAKITAAADKPTTDSDKDPYKLKSIYYDAYALAHPESITEADWMNILNYYYNVNLELQDLIKLVKDSSKNPYLAAALPTSGFLPSPPGFDTGVQGDISSLVSQGLSAVGGLDVTNIADGFAKFLVKRTKEELTVAFFSRFRDMLQSDKFVDLRTVFPQTYQALSVIGEEIYNYQGYIQVLRESFEKDLSSLLTHLPTIVDNHPAFFSGNRLWLAAILRSGCYIGQELRDKTHPGEILNNFPVTYLDSLNANWKGAIQTLQIISASLRDTVGNKDSIYWVSGQKIKDLLAKGNETFFKIYLGLICQKANSFGPDNADVISYYNNISLHDLMVKAYPNLDPLRTFISNFSVKTNKLSSLIRQYKKAPNDSLTLEQYYSYFAAALDLLQTSSQVTSIPVVKSALNIDLAANMAPLFDVAQSASSLVLDINRRNYSSAILNAVHIYDVIRANPLKKATDSSTAMAAGRAAAPVTAIDSAMSSIRKNLDQAASGTSIDTSKVKAIQTQLKELQKTVAAAVPAPVQPADSAAVDADAKNAKIAKSNLLQYGTFMAAIVQAKTSDDVQGAIEAFALPSGSSRIKRESAFNVSLNAYTGLYTGHEVIKGISNSHTINTYGVAAPIGVAISIGGKKFLGFIGNDKARHWSYSFFVSLVDLGAITAFRFNDTLTAKVPTIQLKDIVSPGTFISIGIPKCPLSVNFGAQLGPNLRKVYSADSDATQKNDYANQSYWRFSVGLLVDIPLLNFYTRPVAPK